MLRLVGRSVLVQRETRRVLHGLRQSSGAVEMELRGPLQATIESKLLGVLKPSHLEVINESYMHSVPKNSETHFKVVVVSETFEGMPLLKCHRLVMETLKDEMEKKGGVHALSIQARTPRQWDASGGKVTKSPPCLGGSRETVTDEAHEGSKMDDTFHSVDIVTDTR